MATRVRRAIDARGAVREGAPPAYAAPRLLLDTHVWIWWLLDPSELGAQTRDAIARAAEVWVSAATIWEMSIKIGSGKLVPPRGVDIGVEVIVEGFRVLAIDAQHAMAAGQLPRHHGDPFDRMLIAQAQIEGLTLVTADDKLGAYGVRFMSARL